MSLKIIGAMCIVLGCGGFGFMVAGNAYKEISTLKQLISALEFMECELTYRMTPLPQLCRLAGAITNGSIKRMFLCLANELDQHCSTNVDACIRTTICKCSDLPKLTKLRLMELGKSLGVFDLVGQVKCIQAINCENHRLLNELTTGHKARIRSYKTLGLCAGTALVILFI